MTMMAAPYYHKTREFQKKLVLRALQDSNGNRAHAANRLGLQRTYLFKLLHKFGIEYPGGKIGRPKSTKV